MIELGKKSFFLIVIFCPTLELLLCTLLMRGYPVYVIIVSVPARPISEGAAPCSYWLAPCPIYTRPARIKKIKNEKQKNYFLFLQNVIAVFVFSDSRCKNAGKMLADLCPCFHQSPTRSNFGCSHVKDFVLFVH